jgi:hypothetical protein
MESERRFKDLKNSGQTTLAEFGFVSYVVLKRQTWLDEFFPKEEAE